MSVCVYVCMYVCMSIVPVCVCMWLVCLPAAAVIVHQATSMVMYKPCIHDYMYVYVFCVHIYVFVCMYGACKLYNSPWLLILPQGITQEGDEESR